VLRTIKFRADLPKNAAGKILKRLLRDQAAAVPAR
jgi:acyl-coenzyme A synthetase/AMP-(fatty) acid ligase